MTRFPNPAQSRAVLIGTARYDHLPDIPAVRANLRALAAALTDSTYGTLSAAHCHEVLDPAVPSDVGEQVAAAAGAATDLLLVYYAGHGEVDDDGRLYLTMSRTDRAKLRWTALSYATLREELAASPAAAKIIILDCCFSGRAIETMSAGSQSLVAGQLDIRGTYVITSTEANEVSYAPTGAAYTAFTDALLKASRAAIPLTIDEIFQSVHRQLIGKNLPRPQRRVVDHSGNLRLFKGAIADLREEVQPVTRIHQIRAHSGLFTSKIKILLAKRKITTSVFAALTVIAAAVVVNLPDAVSEAHETPISINDGKYCLTVPGGTVISGTATQISPCTDHPDQQWAAGADGTLALDGKCMTIEHSGNSAPAVLSDCNGSSEQIWAHRFDGVLVNQKSQKCLDVVHGDFTQGKPVQVYGCSGADNQIWSADLPKKDPLVAGVAIWSPDYEKLCLGLEDGGTQNDSPIRLLSCKDTVPKFLFGPDGTIRVEEKCMSVTGNSKEDGASVEASACDGRPSENWRYDGGHIIESNSKKCLTNPSDVYDWSITIDMCVTNRPGQRWVLE